MTPGLIIPGTSSSTGLLITPPSVDRAREQKRFLRCFECGAKFGLDQPEKFGRHVRNCADTHDDRIQAEAHRRRTEPLTSIADPELFAHLRKAGS